MMERSTARFTVSSLDGQCVTYCVMVVAAVAGFETSIRTGSFWNCLARPGDLRRHGGGEQQRLARLGQKGADLLDVGDEAHVEHAVGFVDHQHLHAGHQRPPRLEMVHQAAGRGDQHVGAGVEFLFLVAE
jgi:hypothetical protein